VKSETGSAGYRNGPEPGDERASAGAAGAATETATFDEAFGAELSALMRGRRSIDFFAPEPAGTDRLREAIDLARWAPNHRLTEPWRFYLIGPQTAAALAEFGAEFDRMRKGERAGEARLARLRAIPGFFVLTCRKSDDDLLQREDYAACCCAAQNVLLYLWSRGIGSKWTTGGMTRGRRFYELVGIDPDAETVVGFFWYGRAAVVPIRKRRDVSEITVECP
jgi:nitroreductase